MREVERRLTNAILTAYRVAEQHIMDELRDSMEVQLLVRFRLGDLRELKKQEGKASDA